MSTTPTRAVPPHGGTCLPRDLPQVIGLVRVAEEPPEDTRRVLPKSRIAGSRLGVLTIVRTMSTRGLKLGT